MEPSKKYCRTTFTESNCKMRDSTLEYFLTAASCFEESLRMYIEEENTVGVPVTTILQYGGIFLQQVSLDFSVVL
jgi:hypothetical protein